MDFLKKNKIAILGVVGAVLAFYAYSAFFTGGSTAPLTTSDASTAISQNLLVTLQNLHTIKLDDSVFSDPSFQSLTNFGVTIPSQNVGRANPFLPIGSAPVIKK